jgi:hypothetical protein
MTCKKCFINCYPKHRQYYCEINHHTTKFYLMAYNLTGLKKSRFAKSIKTGKLGESAGD